MSGKELGERVRDAVSDPHNLDGMRKAFRTIVERQKENAARVPDLEARKERLRKSKDASVGNEELLAQALAVLKENGFRVVLLKTADAARRQVLQELQGHKLIVKSKSNVTKELHLSEFLEANGIEVVETDLGDRIIQLAECPAVHPTGPACHLTRGQISDLFSRHFGKRISDDASELTQVMRAEISDYLAKAEVGITGANAITASEGAVVIVHNEGNAAKCAMVPRKHIVVTTPDKIVKDLDEAVNVTKIQTYLSTGKVISSYINVITGPSYTADIEKKVYKGMHGPKEVVLLIVDDGRLDAADKEPQHCIGCGMCLLHCPVYNAVGPVFGSSGHMGGQGVYFEGARGHIPEAIDSGLFLCTACGACTEVCPSSIKTNNGIIGIRGKAVSLRKGLSKEHAVIVSSVRNYDNPWQAPRRQKARWAEGLKSRGEVLYFAGCSTSLLFPENAMRAVHILRIAGVEPAVLGDKEKCCGSTVKKLGEEKLAREKLEACVSDFKRAGAKLVVTSCPGCASALNRDPELLRSAGVEVKHLTRFLADRMGEFEIGRLPNAGKVTYHDPCDLGRGLGEYESPRKLLSAAYGSSLVEMERSAEHSSCCGAGSGVKSAFPELARAMALERIEMAASAGARCIITACPWCVQSLREVAGDRLEVMEISEILEQCMKRSS